MFSIEINKSILNSASESGNIDLFKFLVPLVKLPEKDDAIFSNKFLFFYIFRISLLL